jgi:hypothetical protein
MAAAALAVLAGVPSQAASPPASGAALAAAAPAGPSVAVLDVVMLVDESGSETPAKVAQEKATAATITQTLLNPRSRVTVIGFGGVNHVAASQSPVDVTCQPTIASGTQALGYLTSCVGKLHQRSEQEGNDTDYAAALGQAMSYLTPGATATPPSPAGAIKVILMMTDGAVDVHRNTQQYGTGWQAGEQQAVSQQLAAARSAGAQVWPLGFGTDVGTGMTQAQALAYLNQVAAGGAQGGCDTRQESRPHATWVNNPSDARAALDELYAAAGCLGLSQSPPISIGGSVKSGSLNITIPPIASDAAISVDRGNPGVQVTFTRPDGTQWTDSAAISGQDTSPVEVLHVSNVTRAEAGTWKIGLAAPPGLASQLVSATAFWQGAVRALITANPPSARLGQQVAVTLSVLGPNGPITDPATLASLRVGVAVSGDGLPAPVQVPVSNAGESPSSTTGVGDYKGTFTAPTQPGTLTFTGAAAGYGLYATEVPATVSVGTASAGFTATPSFPVVTSVQAGDAITGQVVFTNQTGAARHVRLQLATSGTTAALTSPAAVVSVPSGSPPPIPFTVTFDRASPAGAAWIRVQVVDASTGQQYNSATLDVTVTRPPGFLAKYLWDIIAVIAAIAAIIAAILWRRAVIRARKDVRGLIAMVRRDGAQLSELKAPGRWSDSFRFVIRDETEPTARLDYNQPGFAQYTVRRSRSAGEVTLLTPLGGQPYDVVVGGPGVLLEHNGLELAFRDARRRARGGVPRRPAAGKPRPAQPAQGQPGPLGQPPLQGHPPGREPLSTQPIAHNPPPKDEWL